MVRYRLAILAAALLWSTAGAAIKVAQLTSWQLAAGRSIIAGITLALLFAAGRRRISRRGFLAALAYAATVLLFVISNKLTTSANAIFLQDTAPLYVLLFSPLLLGEKPTRGELGAAPVFLFGLAMFFVDKLAPGQLWGNVVALVSGVAFALLIMGLRATQEEGMAVLVWGNGIAGIIALGPALAPFFAAEHPMPLPGATEVWIILFLGVVQLALSYVLFQYGLRQTPAVEASLLVLLEPVLNPIWTFFLAGERPGPWALVGGAIILLATAWRTVAGARAANAAPTTG